MIELIAARTQADLEVSQAFAESHLSKGHGEELIPAAKVLHLVMTAVTSNTTAELLRVNPLDELRENSFARIHARILARRTSKKMAGKGAAEFKSLTLWFRPIILRCRPFHLVPSTTTG